MNDADAGEFTAFVTARSPSLLRTAYLLTGSDQAAEDLLQTALLSTLRHWRRIRDREMSGRRSWAVGQLNGRFGLEPWPQPRLHPLDPPSPSGCKPPRDAPPPAVRDSQNQQGSEKEREEGGERRDSL